MNRRSGGQEKIRDVFNTEPQSTASTARRSARLGRFAAHDVDALHEGG